MNAPEILVVGSSPSPGGSEHYSNLIRGARVVIAADGGLSLCLMAERVPDVCVGDFDSVEPSALVEAERRGARVVRYPVDKDMSDLDLAAKVAREFTGNLTITAAFTGRLDHTLASLGTLFGAADMLAVAAEPEWTGYTMHASIRPELELSEPPGQVISLMSLLGCVVSIEGFEYPLTAHLLRPLSSLGLSNVARLKHQRVVVHEGALLVVVNRRLPLS